MGTSYNPPIATEGLVFCLDAANVRSYPKAGTVWTDLAGGNNGTLTNGPTFDSENGGTIIFDGANDYIDIFDNGFLTELGDSDKATLCLWIKFTGNIGYEEIFSTKPFNSNALRLYLYPSNGINKINLWAAGAGHHTTFVSDEGVVTDTWYFICVTLDGSFQLYVNGETWSGTSGGSGTGSLPNTNFQYSDAQYIGKFVQGPGPELNGNISNIMLYKRVLSVDEIRQNYQATLGRFT